MKQENFLFSKCEGQFFTWYGCQSEKHSYDIVVNNRTGELSYLTNGLEGEMNNVHGSILKHLKIKNITLTVMVKGVVKEIKTIDKTIRGAINRIKQKDVVLIGARLLN